MIGEEIERTLVVVKPDGVAKRLVGKVLAKVEELGLMVKRAKSKRFSPAECEKFYPKTKKNLPEIYAAVEKHMTENSSVVFLVEGEDAIRKVRELKGPTDLLRAPPGTIRKDFITDEEREMFRRGNNVKNVMHAPDDKEEAELEIALLFGKKMEE